jgi:hypothetical protein
MAIMLLPIPAIGSRLDSSQANRLADGDVDSLGDYQKFASVTQQSCASQALTDAMRQESFPGFDGWAGTMPRDHAGILEQSFEHCLDLLFERGRSNQYSGFSYVASSFTGSLIQWGLQDGRHIILEAT